MLREEPICAVRGCGRPSTTVDHRVPLSKGGSRLDRGNLQGMCGPHNFAKGAKMPLANAATCECSASFHGPSGCLTDRPAQQTLCTACRFFACPESSRRWVS